MTILLSAGGLKFAFDVKTTLNISDIALYPSQTTHGYDIYASSIDKEDILFLDLSTGEIRIFRRAILVDLPKAWVFKAFADAFETY